MNGRRTAGAVAGALVAGRGVTAMMMAPGKKNLKAPELTDPGRHPPNNSVCILGLPASAHPTRGKRRSCGLTVVDARNREALAIDVD